MKKCSYSFAYNDTFGKEEVIKCVHCYAWINYVAKTFCKDGAQCKPCTIAKAFKINKLQVNLNNVIFIYL